MKKCVLNLINLKSYINRTDLQSIYGCNKLINYLLSKKSNTELKNETNPIIEVRKWNEMKKCDKKMCVTHISISRLAKMRWLAMWNDDNAFNKQQQQQPVGAFRAVRTRLTFWLVGWFGSFAVHFSQPSHWHYTLFILYIFMFVCLTSKPKRRRSENEKNSVCACFFFLSFCFVCC